MPTTGSTGRSHSGSISASCGSAGSGVDGREHSADGEADEGRVVGDVDVGRGRTSHEDELAPVVSVRPSDPDAGGGRGPARGTSCTGTSRPSPRSRRTMRAAKHGRARRQIGGGTGEQGDDEGPLPEGMRRDVSGSASCRAHGRRASRDRDAARSQAATNRAPAGRTDPDVHRQRTGFVRRPRRSGVRSVRCGAARGAGGRRQRLARQPSPPPVDRPWKPLPCARRRRPSAADPRMRPNAARGRRPGGTRRSS